MAVNSTKLLQIPAKRMDVACTRTEINLLVMSKVTTDFIWKVFFETFIDSFVFRNGQRDAQLLAPYNIFYVTVDMM